MIKTATARRRAGDWAGACAAAGFDVDIDLRSVTRIHGRALTARVRADLLCLAPDLLRWHLPRVAPDGLLRPGLTMTLARYDTDEYGNGCGKAGPAHLVVRTAPAWADAGQRISLALWTESNTGTIGGLHPHPRPNRRYRLDLHRHLWDADSSGELRIRSGAAQFDDTGRIDPRLAALAPPGCAVDRWADEAAILLRDQGCPAGPVLVRAGARRVVVELPPDGDDPPGLRVVERYPPGLVSALPILPDAATWTLPDLELLRAGAIAADQLHPLVASALEPGYSRDETCCGTASAGQPRWVECRGEQHRIGLVDGVLAALDHDPAEIRREELLVALTGTPLPCLQAIDRAYRQPDDISGVRERLAHGDVAGALAVVDGLVGPGAALRSGALLDELEAAAQRRITYGLFRSGLSTADRRIPREPRRPLRSHPRHATLF
ncbi:hypothetical protein KHQ06_15705 [Nocardia tengchongensis]|uniref:Uncharacterized protein n=2 Tax=Nocardia tengchongensis TaxID=2055889 RepID=A0ABX8D2I1_9NOCA|nr:hypothetical protein KHQ06_15705 [Nocardia tengchongensis]